MNKYTLLSIKPKYIRDIIAGEKLFEFRKKIPDFNNKTISKTIILYCSKPTMKIIGTFTANTIYTDSFERIAKAVNASKTQKESLSDYFINKSVCHAMLIEEFTLFEEPITLKELREDLVLGFGPGQNYRFLNNDSPIIDEIKKRNGIDCLS